MTVVPSVFLIEEGPLTELVNRAWRTAEVKGFHEPLADSAISGVVPLAYMLGTLANALESSRAGTPYRGPLDLSGLSEAQSEALMRMLLIVSECWEVIEAVIDSSNEAEEVADIAIRLFDYCGCRSIDLDAAVGAKMAKNRDRPYKHGKLF